MTVIASHDPRVGQIAEDVAPPTAASEVKTIVQEAAGAASELEAMLPSERSILLHKMADALETQRDDLVHIADRESAIGPERLHGELTRTINQLRLFSAVLEDGSCFEVTIDEVDTTKTPPQPDLRRMLTGLGPVAVFGASNFPFAFSAAGGDTASALAAGCPVVLKVHGSHPRLDTEVVRILQNVCVDSGLSAGTIGWVYGRSAGQVLVQSPEIQAVGFTGSETAGRFLMDLAAAREQPIPVYAEMGSLNPVVISPGVVGGDSSRQTAENLANSVTLANGQLCTKPGLVFVPTGTAGDDFVHEVSKTMATHTPQYMLSVGMRDSYLENIQKVQDGQGVRTLISDEFPRGPGSLGSAALAEVTVKHLAQDTSILIECFGPASLVIRYQDETELSDALDLLPPSLTTTIHATEHEVGLTEEVQRIGTAKSGRLIFNGFPTGVAVTWAQHHGGPYPAASSAMHTSVGATAIRRFLRPTTYQSWPDALLPLHLQADNPLGLPRRVNGVWER